MSLDQFRQFAAERGYELPPNIEPGRRVRFSVNGKRHKKDGWAILFPDCAGGVVGDWHDSGNWHHWQAKRDRPLSADEHRAWQQKIAREKAEALAEREREANEAAARAAGIWASSGPAPKDHPYLTVKGIEPHSVRVYSGPQLVIGEMSCAGALIVPLYNSASEIRSLQFIGAEGEKRFLPGGVFHGCYFPMRGRPPLCIAEGFSSAATIRETAGNAVAAAMTAGNLEPVARAFRAKHADAEIVVCADDDIDTKGNPGITKATEAAKAIGALIAIPDFGQERKPGCSDFNDLATARSPDAVRAAIAAARSPDEPRAAAADAVEWPEPQPIPDRLPAVDAFSPDLLPDELRDWIADIADRVQCPIEFPAVAAITALGAAIGRKLAVRPKAQDDWEEYGNLWGVIIGAPGVLKSPAMLEALRPLRSLEKLAADKHENDLIEWRAERERAKVMRDAAKLKARRAATKGQKFDANELVLPDSEEEPQPRRYIVNDSSVEKLHLILKSSPNGVLAYRDELIGLLKSLDKEGAESARAFYLSAWSGKESHTSDRIGRGTDRVEHCCVSMLGSIQPAVIGGYLRDAFDQGGGDGLLSRFSLLVWPDASGEWRNIDRWPDGNARQAARAVFERIDSLDMLAIGAEVEEGEVPFLRFSANALGAFVEWREDFERKQRNADEHPALIAHFNKYRKTVPVLAMILHLASRGTGPISEPALMQSLAWADVLESHARRAYASVRQTRTDAARALLAKIRAGAVPDPIRPRDVYLKGWSGLSNPEDVRRAIELLEDLDYLRGEVVTTPGRSRTVHWINPRARA
jgi:putative DNA primase/helicase